VEVVVVDVVVVVVVVEVVAALLFSIEKLDCWTTGLVVVVGLDSEETEEGAADGVWDGISADVFWMSEELLTTSAAEAELIVFFCVVMVFSLIAIVVISTQI